MRRACTPTHLYEDVVAATSWKLTIGAEYMAKMGYDPQEMLEMLAIMKDYESLLKKRARLRGASKQIYHGIFATHPRNDSRCARGKQGKTTVR